MREKFYFVFGEEPSTRIKIDEPIGYMEVDFLIKQKDNSHGRDVSLNGGESKFTFTDYRNHYLDRLLYYNNYYGFEAKVDLVIVLENGQEFISEMDFSKAETDDLSYISINTIQKSSLQIVKRRMATKVDLFSDKDLDGNPITPLVPENILVLAKPIIQTNRWENKGLDVRLDVNGNTRTKNFFVMPWVALTKSGIDETFTPYSSVVEVETDFFGVVQNADETLLFKTTTNLNNITIDIKDLQVTYNTSTEDSGDGYVNYKLELRYGLNYDSNPPIIFLSSHNDENQSFSHIGGFKTTIDNLNTGDSIWLTHYFNVRQSATAVGKPNFIVDASFPAMSVDISATSTTYNSVNPSFRLIDVMKQVVKSISTLQINAPRYDILGEFYNNRLVNGNLLRNVTIDEKESLKQGKTVYFPFYVSLEDIEKSINPEHNAGSEIGIDEKVFFGIEEDYYTSNEMMFFDTTQFSGMKKTPNPKFSINTFKLKYKNYQSLKENEEINSADAIHGESEWNLKNVRVENKKENEIEWIRDPFSIEEIRKKSIVISEDTSSQEDDSLICFDCVDNEGDRQFKETTELNHGYNSVDNRLSLINDNSINFVVLGIKAGTIFTIEPSDNNAGTYLVTAVTTTTLTLNPTAGVPYLPANPNANNNGIRSTRYTYTILQSDVPFVIRTNEEITSVDNLQNEDKFANMRYSIKRNILNYWNSYLATCNLHTLGKTINNTKYKNNPKCTFAYNGLTTIESEDFIPSNPIMTTFLYNEMIFANVDFEDYLTLQERIRSVRGFIRTIDNNGRVLKAFPMSVKYVNSNREIIISGQEKFEKAYLTITTGNGFLMINNETGVKRIIYKIEDYKVYLYDKERQLLYNGVFWNQTSINNAVASSIDELKQWLNLLT
jgi:hypothetical protein